MTAPWAGRRRGPREFMGCTNGKRKRASGQAVREIRPGARVGRYCLGRPGRDLGRPAGRPDAGRPTACPTRGRVPVSECRAGGRLRRRRGLREVPRRFGRVVPGAPDGPVGCDGRRSHQGRAACRAGRSGVRRGRIPLHRRAPGRPADPPRAEVRRRGAHGLSQGRGRLRPRLRRAGLFLPGGAATGSSSAQSPVAWYAQERRYDVAPGYHDRNFHFERVILLRMPILPRRRARRRVSALQPLRDPAGSSSRSGCAERLLLPRCAARPPAGRRRRRLRPDDRQPPPPSPRGPRVGLRSVPPPGRRPRPPGRPQGGGLSPGAPV